jgi:spore coat protein A
MHLVKFQVLNRQAFDPATGLPTGPVFPPRPEESGWKDTVQALPGELTRVITRFEGFTGLYPYHCHVLEHEDHEMMRQFEVVLGCGSADFDGDGDVGTDADIEAFFACLAGSCCPSCYPGGADFNADGDVGTDSDIESFFPVLAGGPC